MERLGEVAGLQEIIETQAVHLKPRSSFSDWKGFHPSPPKTKTKEQKSGKMFKIFPGENGFFEIQCKIPQGPQGYGIVLGCLLYVVHSLKTLTVAP